MHASDAPGAQIRGVGRPCPSPSTCGFLMVSAYRLYCKAICCKAKLETRLECRQHGLTEQPAGQNNASKAGTAMGAAVKSQPQTWLLQRCLSRARRGGTWWD